MKLYSKTLSKGFENESVVSMILEGEIYYVVQNWKNNGIKDHYRGKDSVQATAIYENLVTWN